MLEIELLSTTQHSQRHVVAIRREWWPSLSLWIDLLTIFDTNIRPTECYFHSCRYTTISYLLFILFILWFSWFWCTLAACPSNYTIQTISTLLWIHFQRITQTIMEYHWSNKKAWLYSISFLFIHYLFISKDYFCSHLPSQSTSVHYCWRCIFLLIFVIRIVLYDGFLLYSLYCLSYDCSYESFWYFDSIWTHRGHNKEPDRESCVCLLIISFVLLFFSSMHLYLLHQSITIDSS